MAMLAALSHGAFTTQPDDSTRALAQLLLFIYIVTVSQSSYTHRHRHRHRHRHTQTHTHTHTHTRTHTQIQGILKRQEVEDMLLLHLEGLMAKPEGMMLAMVGLTPETLVPLVSPMVQVCIPSLGTLPVVSSA
jgi:DNA-directed RNA polymerase beta' subunit